MVKLTASALLELASTMPSKPILTSVTSLTPLAAQVSISLSLIARDALVMSGCSTPTPAQNSFRPPPEPVLSTTGAGKPLVWPKVSATAVENGKTVDEPTMRIWSRASALPARATTAAMVANANVVPRMG